jgi:hypothetical protein
VVVVTRGCEAPPFFFRKASSFEPNVSQAFSSKSELMSAMSRAPPR